MSIVARDGATERALALVRAALDEATNWASTLANVCLVVFSLTSASGRQREFPVFADS